MSKVFAAGVLVVDYDSGLVLAIKRADGNGYGFPCGKLNVKERPMNAAVRECFEETGHVVIASDSHFTGDDGSGNLIRIYFSQLVAVGQPTHPNEGEVVWISPELLITKSAWSKYNNNVFAHFGIEYGLLNGLVV